MNARDLIALAAAHSIDVVAAAGSSTNYSAAPSVRVSQRLGMRNVELLPPSTARAYGSATHSMRRPEWSMAELGQASQGVREIAFMAACFAFAGHHDHYWSLQQELAAFAMQRRRHERWPAQVRAADGGKRFYLETLAALVLDEDMHIAVFLAAPALYPAYLGVDEQLWSDHLLGRFELLKMRFWGWLDEAVRQIKPRLEEQDAG